MVSCCVNALGTEKSRVGREVMTTGVSGDIHHGLGIADLEVRIAVKEVVPVAVREWLESRASRQGSKP